MADKPKVTDQSNRAQTLFDLTGRVTVITGGAGLLGTKHAEIIAAAGGSPVLLDLPQAKPEVSAAVIARIMPSMLSDLPRTLPSSRRSSGSAMDYWRVSDTSTFLLTTRPIIPRLKPAVQVPKRGPVWRTFRLRSGMMISAWDSPDLSCAAAYLARRWRSKAKGSFSTLLPTSP